ncbi:spore coat protein [Chryseomicrobium excrementi]|uniref:Spore coat protein n=1 Tax=Chryseomicrobium excrementi TaxID=2041346 RepID=A0A2M9EZX1_9BACL|nr:CotH kinase family protein [Chryseomicrobium excrementi]PJK16758.1 spore coat protein [Chryseomicrobium excrementi]
MKILQAVGVVLALIGVFVGLTWLQNELTPSLQQDNGVAEEAPSTSEQYAEPTSTRLIEDKTIYDKFQFDRLEHVYITIFNQDEVVENDITFRELDESYKQFTHLEGGPDLQILFQVGDEEGPSGSAFTKGIDKTNATIELRGRSSRLSPQKSYKIRLKDSAGLWYGQSVLNLNKHHGDRTRVRNKLAFDYFTKLPDIISLRTTFVELHVKDQTQDSQNEEFESYGLYTHVEQLNEEALAARKLNSGGQLYKIENFEFLRYPEALKLADDPTYDKEAFERILGISGSEDHTPLLEMLDAVNDPNANFDQVFETYFDRDNYLTFLAINFLFGNYDTMASNYYLYHPLNQSKWYLIPWDFDGALGRDLERVNDRPMWQGGVARYWGTSLHRRFLRNTKNIEDLKTKIEELETIITTEQTTEFLDAYYPVVNKYINQRPDIRYLDIEVSQFETYYSDLYAAIDVSKDRTLASLDYPMPIFLHHESQGEEEVFTWDASFDLQNEQLSYRVQLSKTPTMENLLHNEENTNFELRLPKLERGRYYFRVLIEDTSGHQQIPFDFYVDQSRIRYWGVKEVIVR